jgi:hypothetical protein
LIRYDAGSEFAPDDPFGRTVLVLERSGAARLGNWRLGRSRAWAGRLDGRVFEAVLSHLSAGGFPERRPAAILPGAAHFTLTVEADPPQSVLDSLYTDNAGYRNALVLLNGVVRQLSGDAIPVGPPPAEALVHDPRTIDIGDLT